MTFHPFQQLLAAVGADIQVALCHVSGGLQVFPAPGIAKRPETGQQIAPTQAVNDHQQMHRQRQQTVSHRLQNHQ
ncbi:hypothetical protein D9M70_642140 [compost metagenome]